MRRQRKPDPEEARIKGSTRSSQEPGQDKIIQRNKSKEDLSDMILIRFKASTQKHSALLNAFQSISHKFNWLGFYLNFLC